MFSNIVSYSVYNSKFMYLEGPLFNRFSEIRLLHSKFSFFLNRVISDAEPNTIRNMIYSHRLELEGYKNIFISSCIFIRIKSDGDGGAIKLDQVDNLTLTKSTFKNCSADNGGVMYLNFATNQVYLSRICVYQCSAVHSNNFAFISSSNTYEQNYTTLFKCETSLSSYSMCKIKSNNVYVGNNNSTLNAVNHQSGSCCGLEIESTYTTILQSLYCNSSGGFALIMKSKFLYVSYVDIYSCSNMNESIVYVFSESSLASLSYIYVMDVPNSFFSANSSTIVLTQCIFNIPKPEKPELILVDSLFETIPATRSFNFFSNYICTGRSRRLTPLIAFRNGMIGVIVVGFMIYIALTLCLCPQWSFCCCICGDCCCKGKSFCSDCTSKNCQSPSYYYSETACDCCCCCKRGQCCQCCCRTWVWWWISHPFWCYCKNSDTMRRLNRVRCDLFYCRTTKREISCFPRDCHINEIDSDDDTDQIHMFLHEQGRIEEIRRPAVSELRVHTVEEFLDDIPIDHNFLYGTCENPYDE